jgi:hypothetical protein
LNKSAKVVLAIVAFAIAFAWRCSAKCSYGASIATSAGSSSVRPHHGFYTTRLWVKRRLNQLQRKPFCCMCQSMGQAVPATVADHVLPHEGDWNRFRSGKLQSLCELHHNSAKKRDEAKAYSSHIGTDGWPVDPNHPVA